MLELLGLQPNGSDGEKVAILVGPNGAGKSNFLRKIAEDIRYSRKLAIICNTAYDRFTGLRGIKRISASRASRSPKSIVKLAIANSLGEDDSRFYRIAKILDYCGYQQRIGFKVVPKRKRLVAYDLINEGYDPYEAELVAAFLEGSRPHEIFWVGERGNVLGYSKGREFSRVLGLESTLRKDGYLRDIQVYLNRHDGPEIELLSASSGELALISSLLFLIANDDEDPVILIDEPENSLHPRWQREYVDKLLNALEYRNPTIIIATHAPLVVTGALAGFPNIVSVFRVENGQVGLLSLSSASQPTESIEEILWRAFEVITPASHFVSEQLVGVVALLEQGEIDVETALARVNAMDESSFENKQRDFFGAVRELIHKVGRERQRQDGDG